MKLQQPNNQQLKKSKTQRDKSAKKSEELRLLQSLTQVISEAPDFDSALCIALRQVCQLTNWDYGEAWLPGPDNTVLKCSPAWYGKTTSLKFFRKKSEKLTFPANIGLPGRVWTSKQPEWISDIFAQPKASFVRAELAQGAELKAG